MILRLGRKEDASEPVVVDRNQSIQSVSQRSSPREEAQKRERGNAHDILRMIIHACIPQIEPLQISHRRRLDHLGELEMQAQRSKLGEVVRDETELVLDCEVLDFRGRGRRGVGARVGGRG